jgi:hypothetical protein
LSREQDQIETVGDLVDAIFDGNARHEATPKEKITLWGSGRS